MSWYELKCYVREAGSPGRLVDEFDFDADNDDGARSQAYHYAKRLAPNSYGVLLGRGDKQLATYEAPDAQGS
jgi:hypothetical protein